MTSLKKLLFENANNSENIDRILFIAKESAVCVISNNSYIYGIEIRNDGKVDYTFTKEALDLEYANVLFHNASDAFSNEFAQRLYDEIPDLFFDRG